MNNCVIDFNQFLPKGLFYHKYLERSNSNKRDVLLFNANSVDPDQTPRSAASDHGLHCLPPSLAKANKKSQKFCLDKNG